MPIAQGCTFGFILSQKGPINICSKVSLNEDMDILRMLTELPRLNELDQCCCHLVCASGPLLLWHDGRSVTVCTGNG
jgi:hypothetical protein